ncbi:hypothetical protein BH708_02385 [Brachybacterium sp. P6-10-X1]|nr:hypothetical protein BH708_02385 [Brachybacterium sp. P6-10-X1]
MVLVDPEPHAVRFRDVAQERVHDRETLLGACRRVFDLQARAWAYTFRHREDIVQDACVIALSKMCRAEAECPGAEALVPEGLVYWIVRGVMRHRSEGDGRYVSTESGQGRELLMAQWEEHVGAGGVASMRRFDQMAERIRDSFPVGRRPTRDYQLSRREQAHAYCHQLAEDAHQRLASPDPTADAALDRDPETCPADLSESIARLVERRAARGQSIGAMITFAYRLSRPKGQAAIRRAREVADHILTFYGDHLDAHAAAALWRTHGLSPLTSVFGADQPEDRDLVLSVLERLGPEQADAFLASVLEDLSAGVTYRDRQAA